MYLSNFVPALETMFKKAVTITPETLEEILRQCSVSEMGARFSIVCRDTTRRKVAVSIQIIF
jgi:hypothetical protein